MTGRAAVAAGASAGSVLPSRPGSPERGWSVASISQHPAAGVDRDCVLDVRDAAAMTAAVAEISKHLDPLEAAVSCAGHYDETTALEIDPESWNAMLRVHVGGPLNLAQAVLPGMLERGPDLAAVAAAAGGLAAGPGSARAARFPRPSRAGGEHHRSAMRPRAEGGDWSDRERRRRLDPIPELGEPR